MNTPVRKNRKYRKNSRGWESYAVGAVAVAMLLTTTACGSDDDGSDDAKSSPSVTSTQSPTGASAGTPSASAPAESTDTPTEDPADTGGTTEGDQGGDSGNETVAACTEDVLTLSAEKEPADAKDARHLLITARNDGDTACNVYNYPWVELGNAQTTVPVIKDSDPDPGKPVTIEPGQEAHAAVLVAGGGRDEYEVTNIALSLQGKKPGSISSEPISVTMPVAKLYADDGQLVTYWTTASGYALDFIMSK